MDKVKCLAFAVSLAKRIAEIDCEMQTTKLDYDLSSSQRCTMLYRLGQLRRELDTTLHTFLAMVEQ